jgi:prevent-host-death family protein
MLQLSNTWTMQQFRHSFEVVVAAASRAPQLITNRGMPAYVLVPETKAAARRPHGEQRVTLHKLQRPRGR